MKASSLVASLSKRLEGKVAIITGGTGGIGAATVKRFVKEGAKIVIADVQDELANALCNEINLKDEVVSYMHCDVSKESDVQKLVNTTMSKHGKLDIMFSNAGISRMFDGRISTIKYEDFKRIINTNVFGAFLCAKHASEVMIPSKKGSIVFTSSVASVTFGGNVHHAYVASKTAVVGLTKNLCVELGQYGIRVNCISPFGIVTPLMKEAMGGLDEKAAEDLIHYAANLKGTILEAEDIANAALYLASDEARYVSGLNLVVDGGYSTTNISLEMSAKRLFS